MPQSLARIYVHIIFSTKNRQRFLLEEDIPKAAMQRRTRSRDSPGHPQHPIQTRDSRPSPEHYPSSNIP